MARGRRNGSQRLVVWLVVSFALTVLSFLVSTGVGEMRSQGIGETAHRVTTDALPSIVHLGRARTEVRQFEVLVIALTERLRFGVTALPLVQQLQASRAALEREWQTYLTLPVSAGERDLWPDLAAAHQRLIVGLERVLLLSGNGHDHRASHLLQEQIRPALEQLDQGFAAALELNDAEAARQARRIEELRRSARAWSVTLDSLSVGLSLLAAVVLVRVVRQHTGLMQDRMTELEQFAGRVAHDIRSPLAAVGLSLDLARREPGTGPRTQSVLERGGRALQRCGALVDGLLVFARAGARPTAGEDTEVSAVIAGVIEEMQLVAREKEIDLQVKTAGEVGRVAASAGVVTSLVSNLVGNALKHMGPGPSRWVTVRAALVKTSSKGLIRVEVEDSGPGVPEADRERIFDPYVRAAQAAVPGLGLGLATVRRLVEAHGGHVGVQSPPGGGSLFWFELPARPAVQSRTREGGGASRPSGAG